MTLTYHRALITGASRGIGRATAIAFAKAGIDLILVSRSQADLQSAVAEAEALGVNVQSITLDLSQLSQIRPALETTIEQFPVDLLINNAGMAYTGNLLETPLADWQQVLTLNLTSVFQCIQVLLPMLRQRQGMVINVASIAGYQAFPGWGAYNVSKAGLIALSKTLAAEERQHGVRVVTLCPGSVNTPLWDTDTVQADFDRSRMLTPETVAQSILHTALLPAGAVIEELTVMPSAGAL
ncbi:MAG: SDR family oxidoreductase [Pegethrix bostrychoides GSE-TBD4-15B]|jgi:short-subunit dehydrogenase|uniref:SDR family oxidoreductase n=1 Tax=Pegethrix bostrychoides GSE-TBD4-15B TaxID=2839662 RepID=A0A951U2X8_9CYAN|nr:SDR family oxidoreductase [Pegethrix bostrychoides GSE-TBD4-15B]